MNQPNIDKIYFIHEGKAVYPEIEAYRAFFADRYQTQLIRPEELGGQGDLAQSICWAMMGFYRQRFPAALVIHDYRSLSVGRGAFVKDAAKRLFNATPDIRIFQNEDIQRALHFGPDVPTVFLPMGVPSFVTQARAPLKTHYDCDFCYIGAMSFERRTPLMLDSFLKRFGTGKLFHLYGEPESALARRYRGHANIVFQGRKSQEEVFAALNRARVAVNYFPNHNPHKLQTPTKLLEYAALGLRILCNEQPQSRRVFETYGLNVLWGPAADLFRAVPENLIWEDNAAFDPSPLLWPAIIAQSGIVDCIETSIKRIKQV